MVRKCMDLQSWSLGEERVPDWRRTRDGERWFWVFLEKKKKKQKTICVDPYVL
jgi:hypothetical protein